MENLNRQNAKVYVKVNVTFDEDGLMLPRSLIWEDGHPYKIDRVLDIRPAYAEKPAARAIGIRSKWAIAKAICFSKGMQTSRTKESDAGLSRGSERKCRETIEKR